MAGIPNRGLFASFVVFSFTAMITAPSSKLSAATPNAPQTESSSAENRQPEAESPQQNEASDEDREATASITVSGRAMDLVGEPVPGATIYLVSTNGIDQELGVAMTNQEGVYEFRNVSLPLRRTERSAPAGTLQVFGTADGFGIAWHGMKHFLPRSRPVDSLRIVRSDHLIYAGEPIAMDLTFLPAATLSGSVHDGDGRPVAGARIRLQGLDFLDKKGRETHKNYREFWAQHLAPLRFRQASTGDDGRFEFSELPTETVAYVRVEHPDFALQAFYAATTSDSLEEKQRIGDSSEPDATSEPVQAPVWETHSIRRSPLEVVMHATRRITIAVVHDDSGSAASDIKVLAQSQGEEFSSGTFAWDTTDEQGQVELRLPPGDYRLVIDPPRVTEYIRTYDALTVEAETPEQSKQVQLEPGCILILSAVDAADGSPIEGVGFWCDGDARGTRWGVQSTTNYVDHPVTNAQGELRAIVKPGTRNYGVGWGLLPEGYQRNQATDTQLVECEPGKTVRVQFQLTPVAAED